MGTKRTCKNDTCECEAVAGEDYCCSYCANVHLSDTMPGYGNQEGLCACGHEGCHPLAPWAPSESRIGLGPEDGGR